MMTRVLLWGEFRIALWPLAVLSTSYFRYATLEKEKPQRRAWAWSLAQTFEEAQKYLIEAGEESSD